MNTRALRLSLLAVLAASCGVDSIATTGRTPDLNATESAKQKEAWAAQDAPTIFTQQLEYRIDQLPMQGEAANIPWAGSYWPTYEDNINHKWAGAGSNSPSKKYELAFYPDGGVKVEDLVSRYHGIESVQKACQTETECSSEFGEVCARREGADAGRCIATWWGICHAWAPAAIMLPEPRHPVTKNGVTFQVQDLKALGSLVHNNTTSKFVSLRCNKQNTLPDGGGIAYDEFGRPTDANRECRDTNAGTYHVLLANYLGVMKQAFVEDRTFNYEVWNQPLRGFNVTQKLEVDASEASRLIGVTAPDAGQGYRFNPNAARFFHMKMTVQYITESGADDGYTAPQIGWYTRSDHYEYVLEVDANGKIIGGEWVGESKQAHPDFLWLPTGVGSQSVAGGAIKYQVVKELILESAGLAPDAGTPGGGSVVARDETETAAVAKDEWKHFGPYATVAGSITVELTGTGDADLYVRMGGQPTAALYDCRPYTGSSNESCTLTGPGPLHVSVHGYDAATVSLRIRYSAAGGPVVVDAGTPAVVDAGTPAVVDAGTPGVVDAGTPGVVDAGTPAIPTDATFDAGVAASAWKHFGPWVAGAGTVQLDMTGTGDGDLYVRKGALPTDAAYDCRPYKNGSVESCTVTGPGVIYVSVKGYTAATVSVRVRFTAGTTPPPVTHLDVTGAVAQGELKLFQVPVTAGRKIVLRTTAPNDVDLYVKLGAAPTTASYDARGYTGSGAETVSITPATTGTLFVGVHGYAASSFTLKSSDQ